MKKILLYAVSFAIVLSLALSSCSSGETAGTGENTRADDTSAVQNDGEQTLSDMENEYDDGDAGAMYTDADVLFVRYTSPEDGISVKEITDTSVGGSIKTMLSSLSKAGKVTDKISDETFSYDPSQKCYAPIGTYWIRVDADTIYRISPALDEIALCDDFYSEGEVLNAGVEVFDMIYTYWSFYPMATQYGTFENGALSLKSIFNENAETEIKATEMTSSSLTFTISSSGGKDKLAYDAVAEHNGEYILIKNGELSLGDDGASAVTVTLPALDGDYTVTILTDGARLNIQVKQ